jgi:hypothetical protein
MNHTKNKVWYTSNRIWTEHRDPVTNQTYVVDNKGNSISLHELFKNYSPKPFDIIKK